MTSTTKGKEQPLPFADILRDLALLRATDVNLAGVFSEADEVTMRDAGVESSVQQSYEFVKEARAAVRIQNRGTLDGVGENLECLREGLEEVLKGLEGTS
jgi:hypothetical protein